MKKMYLFFLFCTVSVITFGQTFFYESFDSGLMPPTGWTIDGLPAQWTTSNTNIAGGVAPEGKFTYINQTTATRLVSPMVDLTGLTSVKFSFAFYYDWYANPAPKLGVATRSHSGAWTSVWEITPTSNVGPQVKDITITNGDVGQTQFQVCIYLNGNQYNLDYFFCDNILLFNPLNLDGGLLSLSGTPTYFADPVEVKNWSAALKRGPDKFPYINSTKSLIGHCLGAAGAIESVAVVLQLYKGFLHPSANCEDIHPDIAEFEDKVPHKCMDYPELRVIAKAGFGFGDVNSCLIFKKWENNKRSY